MTEPTYRQPILWIEGHQRSESGVGEAPSTKQLRERLQHSGVSALSNAELLSIVLRTGPGSDSLVHRIDALLARYGLPELLSMDFGEVSKRYGLGEAKAAQFQAVLEMARRLTLPSTTERYLIRCPQDAANLVMSDMAFLDHEELRVLVLDTKNGVVANLLLYQGTVNSSVIRVSEIFRLAVTRKCPGIIVCHNHPSGSVEPSPEDIEVTKLWVEAAKLLEIDLVDHLIIGHHRFLSLKERLLW